MVGPPSGMGPVAPPRRRPGARGGLRQQRGPDPAGHVPEVKVFEPLGESDSERSGGNKKAMTMIWIVVGVSVIAMVAFALM